MIGKKCYCVHKGIRVAKTSYFQLLKQLQLRLTKNQNQKQLQLKLMKNQLFHRTVPKSKSIGFSQSKQQLKMCTAGRSVVWRYLFAVNKKNCQVLHQVILQYHKSVKLFSCMFFDRIALPYCSPKWTQVSWAFAKACFVTFFSTWLALGSPDCLVVKMPNIPYKSRWEVVLEAYTTNTIPWPFT